MLLAFLSVLVGLGLSEVNEVIFTLLFFVIAVWLGMFLVSKFAA